MVVLGRLFQENIDQLPLFKKMFLINQNPALQGYYGVMQLYQHLLNKEQIPEKKYLPLDVITLENLNNYMHIEDRDNPARKI